VVVSARIIGRAQGGMADTIRRRIELVDEFLDERLEPVADAMRRGRLRARLYRAWRGENIDLGRLGQWLGISIEACLAVPFFGKAWADIESRSPILQRRRVALADLGQETARAQRVRRALRGDAPLSVTTDPAGIPLRDAAE
jgi:hypothetical protein